MGKLYRESGCPGGGLKQTGRRGHLAGSPHSQDTLGIAKTIPETQTISPALFLVSLAGSDGIPENTWKDPS